MRSTRVKACELAAQCVQGQFITGEMSAAKLMALCIFFESYIDGGAKKTEQDMRLLSRRKVKNFRIVSGGKLDAKG